MRPMETPLKLTFQYCEFILRLGWQITAFTIMVAQILMQAERLV
jgi:hypothetical protein